MADLACALDQRGWHAVYMCDHFMPYVEADVTPRGDLLECWTSLTAVSAITQRIRLGTLVLGNSYRHPAVVANMAATLDNISDGRVVLGLGAGWQRNEHEAYGIALSSAPERLAAFDEAVTVITSLLNESRSDFDGIYYSLNDAVCDPKPKQDRLPILVGGGGERRTMRIAAEQADVWHSWETAAEFARKNKVLDEHCAAVGRDPASIRRATGATVAFGDPDQGTSAWDDADVTGDVEYVIGRLEQFASAGADEFIVRDHSDFLSATATVDIIDRLASEVIPHFA